MMLGVIFVALVAPVGIPTLLVRRAERTTSGDHALPDLTPQSIGICIGAVFLLIPVVVLIPLPLFVGFGWWLVAAIVLLTLTLPLVLRPLWIVVYRTALTRWEVPVPLTLREHLNQLRELTRFEFDRVLCLRASFGTGRSCFVILGARQSTLVISEQIVDRLNAEQLLAVLTHEAAHVILNHGNRTMVWGALGGASVMAMNMVGLMTVGASIPRSLGFVRVLVVIMPIMVARGLYEHYVTRRHEAEADDFATGLVGASAMLGALEALGAKGPSAAHIHNRWTTHGTWERRSARIREKDPAPGVRTPSRA
jgi:Zn-dependent protease with chaperone function